MRSFVICTLHRILLIRSNQNGNSTGEMRAADSNLNGNVPYLLGIGGRSCDNNIKMDLKCVLKMYKRFK
jgi:hypothetical protein